MCLPVEIEIQFQLEKSWFAAAVTPVTGTGDGSRRSAAFPPLLRRLRPRLRGRKARPACAYREGRSPPAVRTGKSPTSGLQEREQRVPATLIIVYLGRVCERSSPAGPKPGQGMIAGLGTAVREAGLRHRVASRGGFGRQEYDELGAILPPLSPTRNQAVGLSIEIRPNQAGLTVCKVNSRIEVGWTQSRPALCLTERQGIQGAPAQPTLGSHLLRRWTGAALAVWRCSSGG